MLKRIKICHLTSVHKRYDTRIFLKECKSLSEYYVVNLIVADGNGDEKKNGINIYDIGKENSRFKRILITPKNIYKKAIEIDCDIYHIHDPELIPIGLKLKKKSKKVIYDAHEDFPKQLLGKIYFSKHLSKIGSKAFEKYEKYACKKFDYIITATSFIRKKFLKINTNSIDVNNFPILDEFTNEVLLDDRKDEVCYVGDLTSNRGIKEIVNAMEYTNNIKLNLGGAFSEENLENSVKNTKGWGKVNELGYLNRDKVANILSESKAGLVTLHPIINYQDALPVKMFEYMLTGLPVIASDFPLWKGIIEGNNCGICVNPLDPKEIAKAMEYIIQHPKEAKKMGENGIKVVREKYNWRTQEKTLLMLYKKILNIG